MADEPTGTQPGAEPGAAPTGGADVPSAGKPDPKPDEKTFTQADLDRVVKDRLAKHDDSAAKKGREAALAEHAEDFAELQKRRDSEKTDQEKAAEEHARLQREKDETVAALTAERAARVRAEVIAEKAPDLPLAYKRMIDGTTPEEVEASIAAAQEAWGAERKGTLATLFTSLASMSPDKIVEVYGKDAEWLAELRAGRPVNVGAAAGAPPQRGTPGGGLLGRMQQAKDLPEAKRDDAFVDALLNPEQA